MASSYSEFGQRQVNVIHLQPHPFCLTSQRSHKQVQAMNHNLQERLEHEGHMSHKGSTQETNELK